MKPEQKGTKARRIKELFVQDLARIEGGTGATQQSKPKPPNCPPITSYVCGGSEEAVECVGC